MAFRILSSLVILALAYTIVDISARPKSELDKHKSVKSSAPIVLDPNVIREMKQYKLEVLKSKILHEINLPEPPVVRQHVRLPSNLLKLYNKSIEQSDTEEGDEFIGDPSNGDFVCTITNDTECSRFEFELPQENRTLNSIQIWFQKVYQKEPLYISASLCSSMDVEDRNCSDTEILREIKTELGWTSYEVPESTRKLLLTEQYQYRFCSIEAFGTNFEAEGNQRPFLVANLNTLSERKRRSTRTTSNNCSKECCKIDFYISFKKIGWHFVVYPAGFYANMCYGKCSNEQLNAFPSHYHRTMNLALVNKTTVGEKKEPVWTPCCSPTELKPLEMIYKASNDTTANSTHSLIHHEIPNMIAESCGCW